MFSFNLWFKKFKTFKFNSLLIYFTLFISIISVLYMSNFVINIYRDYVKCDENSRSYSITINSNPTEKLKIIYEKHPNSIQRIFVTINNLNDIIVSDFYNTSNTEFPVQFGRYFSNEDLKNGNYFLILPFDLNPTEEELKNKTIRTLTIGDDYYIKNSKYKIIGISSNNQFLIPYNSIKNKDSINNVTFIIKPFLKSKEISSIKENIKKEFPQSNIIFPRHKAVMPFLSDIPSLILILSLLVFGVLNVIFINLYIITHSRNELIILRICGCTKKELIKICLLLPLLQTIFCFVISSIIFYLIIIPVTSSLGIYNINNLNIFALTIICSMFLFITTITLLPFIKNEIKNTSIL